MTLVSATIMLGLVERFAIGIGTERYRCTACGEGAEGVELCDHQTDPREFRNLAIRPTDHDAAAIRTLRGELRQRASGKVTRSPFNPKRL